jgi:hypothetical protein
VEAIGFYVLSSLDSPAPPFKLRAPFLSHVVDGLIVVSKHM